MKAPGSRVAIHRVLLFALLTAPQAAINAATETNSLFKQYPVVSLRNGPAAVRTNFLPRGVRYTTNRSDAGSVAVLRTNEWRGFRSSRRKRAAGRISR
jgi:hypothetical protein